MEGVFVEVMHAFLDVHKREPFYTASGNVN